MLVGGLSKTRVVALLFVIAAGNLAKPSGRLPLVG